MPARGKTRPRKLPDLLDIRLSVIAGSSYEGLLEEAQEVLPDLQWTAEKTMGMEDLLLAIADGDLDWRFLAAMGYQESGIRMQRQAPVCAA